MLLHYLAKQTLIHLKLKLNTCDYLSEITLFNMSIVILNNTFKTTTPLINAIVNRTLQQFFHSVVIARFSSSTVLNFRPWLTLLKGPPNSIGIRIKIGAVWGPHARLDEINLLFLQIICGITCYVRWRTNLLKCTFVLATSCNKLHKHNNDVIVTSWGIAVNK